MLVLAFEGWAQCRLATDPDPSDEPRGVSGWTFAVAGEPDLDRIIRFQPPGATQRPFCPDIGVSVRAVARDGAAVGDSPLLGARVMLLDDPVFDGRNGLAHEDQLEPIVPFHIRVEKDGIALDRLHDDGAGAPAVTLPGQAGPPRPRTAQALGVATRDDMVRYRKARAERIREALRSVTDPTEEAALRKRLEVLGRGPRDITTASLGFALPYTISLAGSPGTVEDPGGALGAIDPRAPWAVRMLVGIYDSDALCTYIDGQISLPEA